MKTYRLKQRYPSLPKWVEIGAIARYIKMYDCYFIANYTIPVSEVENNPDFWELIEERKPLLVTEDGVEIYINNVELFAVNNTFITASDNKFDFEVCKKEGWKLFFHKSNADEYSWRNKALFSYKDIENYGIDSVNMVVVKRLAKERSKQ